MIDMDPLIVSELDRMLPLPSGRRANWQEVVDRAALRRRRMQPSRRLVAISVAAIVAAALVAVTTPVGAAVVRGLDGFAAWISGEPGEPASPAEQQAFQQANERSWSGFAPGTALRRLIETSASGTSYTLFGFRSGDQLCLRLVARGAVSATSTHCAPLQALQTAKEPALVVAADEGLGSKEAPPNGEDYVPEATSASFGIVSDGITKVLLHADDGNHDALVASNAFLYVADHPKFGVRVRSVQVVAGDGSTVTLPFQSAPFGMFDLPQPPKGTPQGPAHVDRHVSGGTIGWLDAREPRGEPLPTKLRQSPMFTHYGYVFGRLIQPDPQSADRIAVVLIGNYYSKGPGFCLMTDSGNGPGAMGTCGSLSRLFKGGPLDVGGSSSGSDQFSLFNGLASDDVAQIKLFLASGETVNVPLRDNVFLVRVSRSAYPIRLVAYDNQQRVIDIHTFQDDGMTNRAPTQARTSVRELFRVSAADGTATIVRAGDPAGGYRCFSIDFGNDTQEGGCTPWPVNDTDSKGKRDPLMFIAAAEAGNDVFLGGTVPDQVASVTVTFPDGTVENAKTEDGFVVYPIPAAKLANGRTLLVLRAYDRSGAQIAQRGLGIRS